MTVTDGTYTMTAEKGQYHLLVSKNGYVDRIYNLDLTGGENVQDITLCPPGDVNGDGLLTVVDVAMVYAHVKGKKLTEPYPLQCADISGEGQINILDVARLYACVTE